MRIVAQRFPKVHLLLVGSETDIVHTERIRHEISRLNLEENIALLGERHDVNALLQSSHIGVLSSASEGFPLALLEYGMADLAVVTTNVGQCAEVVDHMQTGLLVPPGKPDKLASALITLLENPILASQLAEQCKERCLKTFGQEHMIEKVCQVYEEVMALGRG